MVIAEIPFRIGGSEMVEIYAGPSTLIDLVKELSSLSQTLKLDEAREVEEWEAQIIFAGLLNQDWINIGKMVMAAYAGNPVPPPFAFLRTCKRMPRGTT